MDKAREQEIVNEIASMHIEGHRKVPDEFGLFEIPCDLRGYRVAQGEILRLSLEIVRLLLRNGIRAGRFGEGRGLDFWTGMTEDQIVEHIRREWQAEGEPILGKSICWFG
ncbi:MAG: hypothetical protein PSV46_08900 [Reyranella sp.]|nr:hypothetical protein [Reyranella sp.]